MIQNMDTPDMTARQPWYRILYIQVLVAIVIGVALGYFYPGAGKAMKPLGDGFIALIKMMIAPAIFCTIVHGIASISDMRKVGRIGLKTLVYFETVSSLALVVGLIVGEVLQPGAGFNIDPATLDPKSVANYVSRAKDESFVAHLLAIIPESYFASLAKGDLLQVLLVAVLSGVAITNMATAARGSLM
jgi:aerobic C4-dicarboxylate transport protein